MSQIPATTPATADDAAEAAQFAVMSTDAVLTGRVMCSGQAMSSAEFWAGLLAAALVDTAGSPQKLPADMWPDQDPAVVQEIWDRACVVVSRASQFAAAPWLHRDRLQSLQAALSEAGFHAMAGSVSRSVRLVTDAHPADGEIVRER